MEKFIKVHPRLYWLIVVTLAIVAFSVVTCVGLGKLEKANASDEKTFVVPWGTEMVEISNEGYPYYFIFYDCDNRTGNTRVMFSREPLTGGVGGYYANGYECVMRPASGKYIDILMYGFGGYAEGRKLEDDKSAKTLAPNSGYSATYFSNYRSNYAIGDLPVNNYVPPSEWDLNAPYVKYDSLVVTNLLLDLLEDKNRLSAFENLYDDYMTPSTWSYNGEVVGATDADLSYTLNVRFFVDIPREEYLKELLYKYDCAYPDELYNYEDYDKVMNSWYSDTNARYDTYQFEYAFPLQVDSEGAFSLNITLRELETYVKYFNSEFLDKFKEYSRDMQGFIMLCSHIDKVVMDLETERATAVVYGRVTTNSFERGDYARCIEIFTDVDKNFYTEELLLDTIERALQVAKREYQKELEDKLNDMQTQIDNITGTMGGFDTDFNGNSLWGAVKSLGSGLLGMSGFIMSFAVVMGAFFIMLPIDVQACVGYLFIVALVVILWRLLKK